jgi:acyl transferase domain-containing protein/NADPH:quinone reductase-like Zn-dependent oxidoreductase/NAD(P)-dependent dehydrogenase (short-subunit alcohol dehydrogenase family)/acyl carrier protein
MPSPIGNWNVVTNLRLAEGVAMTASRLQGSMSERVAVVGIGCRYPGGVRGPDQFWRFLETRGDGIVPVPGDRWSVDRFSSPEKNVQARGYVRFGGFLQEDIFTFDPAAFGISPREAEYLDPQQRLLLEAAVDALEDAGLEVTRLRGSNTGVYIGAFNVDMRDVVSLPANAREMSAHTATGASQTLLSNRLSYTFNWHGPSFTVDTACSSSLVATHYACRDLLGGQVDLAVAGGVNVMLSPVSTNIMCKGQFLAPDGRSKAFDAAADGYGRGEGVGLVVLKRLSDAHRDGDRIYAVILASGVNQDGKTDGLPMPNGQAQSNLCRSVVRAAGIQPTAVGFVEAHGTGTSAGDPIETRALSEVYCGASRREPLLISSVKTNIGHLEAAAGVTGLIKAAICVYRARILPVRSLGEVNPEIDLRNWKLAIPREAQAWNGDGPRIAAVNSFGYGGTNAHAIVGSVDAAERPASQMTTADRVQLHGGALQVAALSAYDRGALALIARQSVDVPQVEKRDAVLRSLCRRRRTLPVRAFLHDLTGEFADALRCLADGQPHEQLTVGSVVAERPRVLWVFTGMGPQWWAMGRELLERSAAFRAVAEEVDGYFREVAGWSILEEMLGDEAGSRMSRNSIAQPANFVLQVGLVHLLRQYGVAADGYLGHSVGELGAAWACGALDLRTATCLSFHRSDIQQKAAGRGAMAALEIGVEEAASLCAELTDLSIAAINGDSSVALAGGHDAVDQAVERVAGAGRFAKKMQVEVAYHSHHMNPHEDEFRTRLAGLSGVAPREPLYSTARGVRVEGHTHDEQYWWENARNPVLLGQAVKRAMQDGYDIALEVGPHPVLAPSLKAIASGLGKPLALAHTQRRGRPADVAFLQGLGSLYCAGVDVNFESFLGKGAETRLPLYPFQRKRYWFEPDVNAQYRLGRPGAHPLLDQQEEGRTAFRTEIAGPAVNWVVDHQVQGVTVFPGAGYIESALAMSQVLSAADSMHVVEQLRFEQPLVIDSQVPPVLSVEVCDRFFSVSSLTEGRRTLHAKGRISEHAKYATPAPWSPASGEWTSLDVQAFYGQLTARGLKYGPSFRLIRELRRCHDIVEASLAFPENGTDYLCYPGILDSAFQALLSLLPPGVPGAVVPVGARSVRCYSPVRGPVRMTGKAGMEGKDFVADLVLYSEHGQPLLTIESLVCRAVDRNLHEGAEPSWHHQKKWTTPDSGLVASSVSIEGARAVVVVDPDRNERLVRALKDCGRTVVDSLEVLGNVPAQVVFCLGEDCSDDAAAELRALHLLGLELAGRQGFQLVLVCSKAYRVHEDDDVQPAQAALVGMLRVFMTEYPELDARVIDASLDTQADEVARLLSSPDWGEEEVAIRDGVVRGLRIVRDRSARARRLDEVRSPSLNEAYELHVEQPGRLDSLCFRPVVFGQELGDDEVEIRVQAASLNFKDVMKALGLLESSALANTYLGNSLGLDASGIVIARGKNVLEVEEGDLVFACAPGALASRLRVDSRFVVKAARGHSAADACSYAVYQTVWLGLIERARLQAGETVLVHSAAGAVGLCAVQLAQNLGARVLATAGTEEKRAYLRQLGVEHVYDSRTLDYSGQVLKDTDGRGVDVVLNSLAGDAFLHNFDIVAAGGRLVELGKQDFARETLVPLGAFNRAISLIAVDMDRMAFESPGYYMPVARAVVRAFEEGVFHPLPRRVFPAQDVVEAFRLLGSGAHIGKVVLDFEEPVPQLRPGLTDNALCVVNGTYLVTGGLGGFGLRAARYLVHQGAGRVVLASRRGRGDGAELLELQQFAGRMGAEVVCEALDVTEPAAVQALVARLVADAVPLRGIIHSAMVLDDAPLAELTFDSLARVMNAKAIGAWHLHQATLEVQLDFFVLFSSVSAMVGNPGQAAYSAANCFLDGLAQHRRANGLVATSVQWGAIADVGVVARDAQVETHLRSIGLEPIDPERALLGLGEALREGAVERGIIDIDWDRWMRTTARTRWNRLSELGQGDQSLGGARERLVELIAAAEDAECVVVTELASAVAPVFKMDGAQLDADKALKDFGLDSLMAVEVQAAIEECTGVEISTMELLAGRSVRALAQTVLAQLPNERTAGVVPSGSPNPGPTAPTTALSLREVMLQRICVQPPYFALLDLKAPPRPAEGGTWTALAEPVPPNGVESGQVALAEAARHATILASCAARERLGRKGRVYFPVREAALIRHSPSHAAALPRIQLRASCESIDVRGSQAVCLASVHDLEGREISCFRVTLHIIPEAEFKLLFADARQPTSVPRADPYAEWTDLPQPTARGEGANLRVEVDLGLVQAERCAGHFDGYPAYPVSIMARDAVALVGDALRVQGRHGLQFEVVGGTCRTSRFAFAGESLRLVAQPQDRSDAEVWLVELTADGEPCAEFEMRIDAPAVVSVTGSLVVGPLDDLDVPA